MAPHSLTWQGPKDSKSPLALAQDGSPCPVAGLEGRCPEGVLAGNRHGSRTASGGSRSSQVAGREQGEPAGLTPSAASKPGQQTPLYH